MARGKKREILRLEGDNLHLDQKMQDWTHLESPIDLRGVVDPGSLMNTLRETLSWRRADIYSALAEHHEQVTHEGNPSKQAKQSLYLEERVNYAERFIGLTLIPHIAELEAGHADLDATAQEWFIEHMINEVKG